MTSWPLVKIVFSRRDLWVKPRWATLFRISLWSITTTTTVLDPLGNYALHMVEKRLPERLPTYQGRSSRSAFCLISCMNARRYTSIYVESAD